MNKKILVITYWVNKQGNSPGIMADDKISSLLALGNELIVLSSFDSVPIKKKNVKHFRVPSLNFFNFFLESKNTSYSDKVLLFFFLPFVLSVGILLDLFEGIFLKGKGGGKWIWFISAFFAGMFVNTFYKVNYIFSMGGPASAHLAGLFINFFFKKKLFIELQDPLVGKDIGRSKFSSKGLMLLEKIIIKYCNKLVFVTNQAAKECIFRNYKYKDKVYGVYSGAIKQVSDIKINDYQKKNNFLIFAHIGTLYSSRNFEKIISSLKNLVNRGLLNISKIKIINLGDVYGEKQKKMLNKFYISWNKSIDRSMALKICTQADVLLLIQHTDDRSRLTFPYKTYEYLNFNKIIFGLLNNNELRDFLEKKGHICANINDVRDISAKLNYIINNKEKIIKNIKIKKNLFLLNPAKQTNKIFKTISE
jgi:hypothetical protein